MDSEYDEGMLVLAEVLDERIMSYRLMRALPQPSDCSISGC